MGVDEVEQRLRVRDEARVRLARLSAGDHPSLERIVQGALRIAAETLEVPRVGVWFFDEARRSLRLHVVLDADRPDAAPGAIFVVEDTEAYELAARERRVIAIADVHESPLLATQLETYYAPLGITATLDAPIYREGEVVGIVCHEQRGARRDWTDEDASFAISIAEVLALAYTQTALRQAERELHAAEVRLRETLASEALVRVARGVAHDVNNVLSVVGTTAELIARRHRSPDLLADLDNIRAAVESGARLARRLLTYGRHVNGTMRRFALDPHVAELERLLRSMAGPDRELTLDLGAPGCDVFIDPTFLEQVLLNLVVNAREATAAQGHVTLRTRRAEGGGVSLEVADDGRGMDETTRASCFDPFFTTKRGERGAGFGLSTVLGVVRGAGGEVAIASEPGRGTTVSVRFPPPA